MPWKLFGRSDPETKPEVLHSIRNRNRDQALIFVHGFGGDIAVTWGRLPEFLQQERQLDEWDLFSIGYPSNLTFDLPGLWSADPDINAIGRRLRSLAEFPPFNRYRALALAAHSMGGLVVQRAIVDDEAFARRLVNVILFGTPSLGLIKASLGASLKRQASDMCEGSAFLNDLRQRWSEKAAGFGFRFRAVAGDTDEFVPRESSIRPFRDDQTAVIRGNHLQIVKPVDENSESVRLLVAELTRQSIQTSLEAQDFQRRIADLWPTRDRLDPKAAVSLALALQRLDREPDAYEVLKSNYDRMKSSGNVNPDALGTFGGLMKRRWMAHRTVESGQQALDLYSEGYDLAVAKGRHEQAFYHAINLTFLLIAFADDPQRAREFARRVLKHCDADEVESKRPNIWRSASRGEAYLALGESDNAIAAYTEALRDPLPWQRDTIYQQAAFLVALLDDHETARRIENLFRPDQQSAAL